MGSWGKWVYGADEFFRILMLVHWNRFGAGCNNRTYGLGLWITPLTKPPKGEVWTQQKKRS